MSANRPVLIPIFSFLLLIFACQQKANVSILSENGPILFEVDVSRTEEEHARGLMGRDALAEDSGMLFVFKTPYPAKFWMKDTIIPLDVIFIDEGLNVISIVSAEPCRTEPCPVFGSDDPVKYVLEINGGMSVSAGIKVNDTVIISLPS